MFRQVPKPQQPKVSLPVPQSGLQPGGTPGSSSRASLSPVSEQDTIDRITPVRPQSHRGPPEADIEIHSRSASVDREEIPREVTPFFVRGDRGDPSSPSKIDLPKFDEYLTELENLSRTVATAGNRAEVQEKIIDKLAEIRRINGREMAKMSSDVAATRDAAEGIDNIKAYTYKVTDLLKDAQAGAEHLGLESVGDPNQRMKFESVAALSLMAKRLVRGVGAEKILVNSAKTVEDKLMELMGNRPDSSLITTKTVAVAPPKAFSKYTAGRVDSLVVDEQGLLLYFPAKTASVAGHGTVGIASMTGGITATGERDTFRAALKFSDLLTTTLNEKANSAWIKSNGKAARNLVGTLSAVRHGLGFMTGQLHTEGFSPGLYSNDKLGNTRVENAFAVNELIQKSSLNPEWKQSVDTLVNKFFLPVVDDKRIRQEGSLPPPADPYDVITELIKGSYSDHGANFTAVLGRRFDTGKISPSVSGTLLLSYDRFHFDMQLPSKPSDLLDATFHQDVRETLKLHDSLIEKLNLPARSREKAEIFHQYNRMNTAFAALPAGAPDRAFTADETSYFGEKNSIRPVFRAPILAPSQDVAGCIKGSLDDLAGIHDTLLSDLSKLGDPNGMPKGLQRGLKEQRQAIVDGINTNVWGGAYPGGTQGAMKDIEKFKRQTFYNLEIGLGRVGIELALLNRHHAQGNTSLQDDERVALNDQYVKLKTALTSRDFMDNPNLDIKRSPLKTTADFNRHQLIASGTLVAGANLSSLIYPADVSPANVAGDLYIKFQAQYENAVNQFDTTREGQFLVLSFELSSGVISALPPAARLQEHIVHAVSKTAMAAVGHGIKNEKVKFSDQDWKEISQHLIGVVGTNVQSGAKTAIKLHKPHENAEWRLQKVTESRTRQGGVDGNVPFVEIVAKDSSIKQEQQIVGPDWSINKMTIKYLPVPADPNSPIVLNNEMATRYCSIPNTISQIIDDGMNWTDAYLARQAALAAPGQQAQGNANGGGNRQPYPSDIHRFLGDPVLVRSGEVAPKVQTHVPGSATPGADSPSTRMVNLCRQVGANPAANWAATKAAWDAKKRQIESLPTLEARRAYWGTQEGQRLLRTFVGMVGVYTDVTTATQKHADKQHQATRSGMTNSVQVDKDSLLKTIKNRVGQRGRSSDGAARDNEHELQ